MFHASRLLRRNLVASFADRHNLLKREEKMHAYAARTAMGCTSKTCGDHAHAILHAASACRVFFCRHHHHTRLPLLASTMAQVSSVCTPENSQPAPCSLI